MNRTDAIKQIDSDLNAAVRLIGQAKLATDADHCYNLMTDARIKIDEAQARFATVIADPAFCREWTRKNR